MNKQELKENLAVRNDDVQTFVTWTVEQRGGHAKATRFALDLIDQLDEPEITEEQAWNKIAETLPISTPELKEGVTRLASNNPIDLSKWVKLSEPSLPEVPQFVSNWFEVNKYNLEDNIDILVRNTMLDGVKRPIETWMLDKTNKPIETLISMLDGYTIEPPKKYRVKISDELYFVRYDELEIVVIRDNAPGFIERSKVFDNKEEAEKIADDVNGYVEELPEDEAMKLIEGWKEDE